MSETPTLNSSKKLFSILEHLIEVDGAGVTEIANKKSLAKSTVHLHLQSLSEAGYVHKRGDEYYPSLQLFEQSEQIRNGIPAYRTGRNEVDSLAAETNELVNLGVLENGQVWLVYLSKIESMQTDSSSPSISTEFSATQRGVSISNEDYEHRLGKSLDPHATAMGKAMLAELKAEKVNRLVEQHGLSAHTTNTITDRATLDEELETIRTEGYAEDNEERAEGVTCIAAAISRGDHPIAAVSISGSTKKLNEEYKTELVQKVIDTASMIEVKIAHTE